MPELRLFTHARTADASVITDREVDALLLLCESPYPMPARALGRQVADAHEGASRQMDTKRGEAVCMRLGFAGLVDCDPRGFWITEKGRLASAIIMLRRPHLEHAYFGGRRDAA